MGSVWWMSEGTSNGEEQQWPTRCEHCGHELASQVVDVMPGGDEQLDIPVAQDVCPNPECPSRGSQTDGAGESDPGRS